MEPKNGSDSTSLAQNKGKSPERRASTAVSGQVSDTEHQLPVGRNRVERITEQSKGLMGDISHWIELKTKLVQVEIEEKIDAKVNQAISAAIVAGIALVGVLFLLIALGLGAAAIYIAIGLSQPLSYFLGFLTITLVLFAVAGILQSMKPHMVDVGSKQAKVEERKLQPGIPPRD